ncbi:DEAD/DEAH box helicase [Pararhodobacter oceanensis]|nr:DEAD/DEAH box helicase [Pararhodobacter oceanensis]
MNTPFSSMPAALSQALTDKGYDTLTPVQLAVLDPELAGRDLLVSAQTGSGKTVAFGIAMALELMPETGRLPAPDAPRVLVIAPTRELALQVRREFEWLWGKAGAVLASAVGGMDVRTERRALERGAHIVVGTPGRLRDHIERGGIDLSAVQAVTLDEADEMLDLGFREDLEFILQSLPEDRRTLLFSATVPKDIERMARTYQRDAKRVATQGGREAHADISYRALTVTPKDSENAIVNLLRFYEARNALVFCKTRAAVNHLTARLLNRGFSVVPLSGELAQEERARALQAMRDGRARVCVATDVAARGIDLPGLELVIHADLPSNKETLLHRSGRTGRAGNKGVSALIVPMSARRRTERMLDMAKLEAEWGPAPSAVDVSARDTERLLTDEALTKAEDTAESALITQLAERFSARELAAAVTRMYFAARSAPEDVEQVSADSPKPRARAEFERSYWMRLSTGHNERAEPRWLLPMLCRAGNLTKTDIGAIRIFDDHTLVQLHEDSRERFTNAMGDPMTLEQDITVTPAEAPAGGDRPAPRPRRDDRDHKSGPRDARPPRKFDGERPQNKSGDYKSGGHKAGGYKSGGYKSDDGPRGYDKRPRDDARAPDARPSARPPRPEASDRPARKPFSRDESAPRKDYGGKPAAKSYGDKPRADKPYGDKPRTDKPRADKPRADKPYGDKPARPKFDASNPSARMDSGKPRKSAARPAGKPDGKPAGKFAGKPGGKPGAKPARNFGPDSRPTRPKR